LVGFRPVLKTSPERLKRPSLSRWKRLAIRLTVVVLAVLAVFYTFLAFVNIRTNVLWFDSVDVHDVYGTILSAQILLFLVFGVLTAVAVAASLIVVIRQRPPFRPDPDRERWRYRYLRYERYVRGWLIAVVAIYLGVHTGSNTSDSPRSAATTWIARRASRSPSTVTPRSIANGSARPPL